jgi:uncharacterized protein with PQ loop repeat
MTAHTFGVLAAWGGTTLGFWMTTAQWWRMRREGVAGVALATWVIFMFMGVFWIAYGIQQHSLVIWLSAAICEPLQLSIVAMLAPWSQIRAVLRAIAVVALLCYLPTVVLGWSAGVYGAGVVMMMNRVPQIVELATHEHAEGLSVGSWLLGSFCSSLWVAYYIVEQNWPPMIATAVALAGNLVIVGLGVWRHARTKRLAPAT